MFQPVSDALEQAIDELQIPVDRDALVRCCAMLGKLTAKVVQAVGDYDEAEMWHGDGAVSMAAWLRSHAGFAGRDASWFTKTACKLRQLPVTSRALLEGVLSVGQLKAMLVNVSGKTIGRFAEQEDELVPSLTPLPVTGVSEAMQHWRKHAEAELDDDEPPGDEQTVHLSRTMDGRRELSGSLNPETGAALETALRLADRPNSDNEPEKSPAQRRADALDTVARFFLDHQNVNLGRRHRPHLNVFVNLGDIVGNDDETSGLPDIDAARSRNTDRASGWLADGPFSTPRRFGGCCATPASTASSPPVIQRSWTTGTPPGSSPPQCSHRSWHETSTAASPDATASRPGAKPTTWSPGNTVATRHSKTSPCSAPGTTTCSTSPAGTPRCPPTATSRSPDRR